MNIKKHNRYIDAITLDFDYKDYFIIASRCEIDQRIMNKISRNNEFFDVELSIRNKKDFSLFNETKVLIKEFSAEAIIQGLIENTIKNCNEIEEKLTKGN